MPSNRKKARRLFIWTRYRNRCDKLTAHQDVTAGILAPMRCTPGFFRAEGWDTDNPRTDLRHGA